MADPDRHKVSIEVDGELIRCEPNRPLLTELLAADRVVSTACGGEGTCHLCRVTLHDKQRWSQPNSVEVAALGNVLIAEGVRLSCQLQTTEGMRVSLPTTETPKQRRARIREARKRRGKSS